MDAIQDVLFGRFPRRVGTPNQHWVYNADMVDVFLNTVDGCRGAYATVGRPAFREGQSDVCDKVLFDLDTPAKDDRENNGQRWDHPEIAPNEPADELLGRLRNDADLAVDVLGPVCEDAQKLARASRDDGIPVLGVFSGFGIHVHQLYQPTEAPREAMTSIAAKYHDELDLQTMDWECVGQPEKLCRIPNVERATYTEGPHGGRCDGRPTGVHTVPFTSFDDIAPTTLLEWADSPSRVSAPCEPDDRPQMPVWEAYTDGEQTTAEVPQRPLDTATAPADGDLEALLWDLLEMPCMVERLLQPNPEHKVRMNAAVMLFNAGLSVNRVEALFAQIGWVDFDRDTTRDHLEYIYRNGYADMSCKTLRKRRLCTRADDPEGCSCYGWSGGQAEWTTNP